MASRTYDIFFLRSRRYLPVLMVAAMLGGCSTQATINQPVTHLPEQFSLAGQQQIQPRQQQWWLSFSDPQLEQLMAQALDNNFSLKASAARVKQAEALAKQSGASLLPSLSATADGGRTFRPGPDSDNVQLGLKASYEIDLWSRLEAVEEGAELDYQASRQDLEMAALTISAEVADRWYALLTQQALVKLYQSQLQTLNDQKVIIDLRFQNGQGNSEDVLQQQQQLENLDARLMVARSEQQIIRQQLAVLLGQSQLADPSWNEGLSDGLPDLSPLPDVGLPADVASRRPDLRQAWLELQSKQQGLIVAEADRLPQIRLSASLLSASNDLSVLVDDWATNLAASLTAPLFDGGQRRAEVERQQAVVEESINRYSQKVLEAFADIETALNREFSQQDQLDSITLQLSLAEQTEAIKWARYGNGGTSFLEVLSAQKSRLELEQQQVESHGQLLANRITVHRAIAGDFGFYTESADRSASTTDLGIVLK
ncbi:TolC family protein [Endozoicomonas sp.]|uniref:TolC family protein n=1 Tax=Endozoicomonas sp. TaxID=1892382 RepID=UPI00288385DF|nr:TolC family protein [Endozoicomonas sp.]